MFLLSDTINFNNFCRTKNFNNFVQRKILTTLNIFKKKIFVLNQRNLIFNINNFNAKQQQQSIIFKNEKIKINKLNEFNNERKILNN